MNHHSGGDETRNRDETVEYHYEGFAVLPGHVECAKGEGYEAKREDQHTNDLNRDGLLRID